MKYSIYPTSDTFLFGLLGGTSINNPPASTGDIRDAGSMPGSGRSLGGGHGNSLQYSCLENPMDREAWWTVVYRALERTEVT